MQHFKMKDARSVAAVCWTGENQAEVEEFFGKQAQEDYSQEEIGLRFLLPSGAVTVPRGYWAVRVASDEGPRIIAPDDFAQQYELVPAPDEPQK